ncbi:MAG TPA: beta-galactosidase [Bryobacteraceae bacterium]|nr:beta-galactosidase [Bryobacteraceae bacterium]
MRSLVLLLLLAAAAAQESRPPMVQAVEFPYYAYPPQLWERELVWLKNLGIDTVAFSIPWNWHQLDPQTLDLVGRTSPRRDLIGFVRLVKRAGLRAWIRPGPPVKNWLDSGYPKGSESDPRALRKWLWDLETALDPFLAAHGGPIAFVEGAAVVFPAPQPPLPVTSLSGKDPRALVKSREVLGAGHGSLVWEDIEDFLPPVGWEALGGAIIRPGAVSLAGEERTSVMPLRRDALLWRYWGGVLPMMKPARPVRLVAGKLPPRVLGQQFFASRGASAVNLINESSAAFQGSLQVTDPATERRTALPSISLAPGEALCLPLHIPLATEGFCRDCSGFGNGDHIIYATAELNAVEYENGILAMEFSAPRAGEVVLQLSQEPSGPFLAAGHPVSFDWDEHAMRARLLVPAGSGPGYRVRIGLALQPPDTAAFFGDAKRLVIGQPNHLATSYSSEEVAQRSRLKIPQNFHAVNTVKSPTEIEYEIDVPPDALHGEWAPLALEADGVLMSRARLQLLRPASVRVREAVSLHYGPVAELPVKPALVPVDARAGREVSVVIRNNAAEIRNFVVEAKGDGLEFSPKRAEIAIGGSMERDVLLRVFPAEGQRGIVPAQVHVSGAADVDLPVRFAVIPRGETLAYSADLDGDGQLEWVLENQRARATFSAQDGGRWLEFVWKDSGLDVLSETGALAGTGTTEVQIAPDGSIEFRGKGWRRSVRLDGNAAVLTVEQTTPLPPESLHSGKKNELVLKVSREKPNKGVYSLERAAQ